MKNNILVNSVNSIQIDIDKIDYESSENYRRNYDENKIKYS